MHTRRPRPAEPNPPPDAQISRLSLPSRAFDFDLRKASGFELRRCINDASEAAMIQPAAYKWADDTGWCQRTQWPVSNVS
jgi:hypothetical protein